MKKNKVSNHIVKIREYICLKDYEVISIIIRTVYIHSLCSLQIKIKNKLALVTINYIYRDTNEVLTNMKNGLLGKY